MAESGPGRIRLFEDFFNEDALANTTVSRSLGDFIVAGQGHDEADSGIPTLSPSDTGGGLSGIGQMTTTNEAEHTILIGTPIAFDVARMGTIVAEARIRLPNLDTKDVFFGFSDVDPNTLSVQIALLSNDGSTTLTYVASDLVGFYLSAELTDDEDWHTVYNGGSATAVTASGSIDVDDDAVANEFQVLRLEIANNGTVRWLIDGVLVRTVTGAVSTSTDLSGIVAVDAKGSAVETLDIDYLLIEANRDWTVLTS